MVNEEQRKALREGLDQISKCYNLMDLEKAVIKDIIEVLYEKTGVDKKILRKIAKVYHKKNFIEEVEGHDRFSTIYQEVTGIESPV